MDNKRQINVIVLGESSVGKTSIIKWIKDGKFSDIVSPTIFEDIYMIKIKYERKNIMINLAFYDTPPQEVHQNNISINYIHNSHIVLLVFSDIETLNSLKDRWYRFYKENVNIDNSRFILVGNKSDLFENNRDEILKEGEKFAEEIGSHFLTCSAKTDSNMDNLKRYIFNEAKRFIDFIDDEEKKKKISLWQNSKLNKYISF